MFNLSYKSKFALCVAGAFCGVFLGAASLAHAATRPNPLNILPTIESIAHFVVALNLGVALVAAALSFSAMVVDLLATLYSSFVYRYR